MEPETVSIGSSSTAHFIFHNQHGLRAGWRLLIYLPLTAGLTITTLFPLRHILEQGASDGILKPGIQLISESLSFLVLLLAAFIMSRLERRNMGEYGLPLRKTPFLKRFIVGYLFWGFLPLTLCLVVLRLFHAYNFGPLVLHGADILIWGGEWAVAFVLVGLQEEYLLRGYVLHTLAEGIGFWPAMIVMAALFGLGHAGNTGETRIGLVGTAVFAIFASVTLRYTGNLWLAVGAHAGWNWGQSFFYGVSDSGLRAQGHLLDPAFRGPAWLTGGTVGPEGSVVTLVLWSVMTVVVVLVYRRPAPELVVTTAEQGKLAG